MHRDRQNNMQSPVGSPTFTLNLNKHLSPKSELSFPNPPQSAPRRKRIGDPAGLPTFPSGFPGLYGAGFPWSLLHFMAVTQALVIVILCLLVFGLLYWSWRFNSNVNYFYSAASPYIGQAMDHGLSMFRHVDNSSAYLETVMQSTEQLTQTAMPALSQATNATLASFNRLQQLAANPTFKLSLA